MGIDAIRRPGYGPPTEKELMSTSWKWPGSRWWRVDLHTHSPASHDFGEEGDRTQPDWRRWLEAARIAGIDALAVTDHNTARGISALQQAAARLPGAPVVFPGVEITANDGIHLLLILDPGCTQQHVEDLLAQAQISVDQRGQQDARSPLSVEQLLELDCPRGLVVIGAHVNGPKGLLRHDGQQRLTELRHPRLAGVEIDPSQTLDTTWVDGSRPEIRRIIPQVYGSDGHAFAELGRRFTWVKMTRPDLAGLRLALLDGADSLQPAQKEELTAPNRHANLLIESIEVHAAKYMGRPAALHVSFNPWLNALIGGRGTGKSTLVDLCRKALRRESELNGGADETSLRAAFDKRMRVPANRGEEGLLTADTLVEVTYRKDGERFVVAWGQEGQAHPIVRLDGDHRVPESGTIQERFPVRIYGQKQLFELARTPNALLTIIDDTPVVRGAELARARKEAEARYLSSCAEARALRAQAVELPARRAALADVRRKLDLLQQGGHAQAFNEYRLRQRQDGTWTSARRALDDGLTSLARATDALVVADLDERDATGDPALAALRRVHARARAAVQRLQESVMEATARAREELTEIAGGADASEWRQAVAASEQQYQRVAEQLGQAGITNPDEYRDLLQRAATLEQEIQTLEQRHAAAGEREQDAARELERFRSLRSDLTSRRESFARDVSGSEIRIEIQGSAARGAFEAFLRATLGIGRFDEDYKAIVQRVAPEVSVLAAWSYQDLDAEVAKLRALLVNPQEQWPAQDRRFEPALRKLQPERIDRLALYVPEDLVDVSFRDVRDIARQWRKLSQGSPGQQTAALLAFVLSYGDEPIILDQPEDDLDNTLIYELLVRRLRESKQRRQIIVVTHNPNIVVHGDAELVVSLDVASGQTQIEFAGGLQEPEARDEICRVMEGGRKAFATRYRRIMQPGANNDG